MNDDIKSYTTPSGNKRYKFTIYLGRDARTGRPRQIRKQGYKTEKQAKKDFLQIQVQIANGEYSPEKQQRLKFKEVYEKWLDIYSNGIKESTLATTIRIIEGHVLPDLGKYYIDSINMLECQKAVNKWYKDAPRTYKKYIRYANRIFHYAMHLELIDSSPMDKVMRPRVKPRKKYIDFYTKEELNKYLEVAYKFGIEAYTLFYVLAYTGLRKGEALTLEWKDIDFKNKTLSVQRTLSKGIKDRLLIQTPKTINSIRTISLTADTVKVLKQWQAEQRKEVNVISIKGGGINQDNFIFNGMIDNYPDNIPLSYTTVSTWNSKIAKKAKLRHIRIHDFRHTHASLLFDAGISMQDIKDRLGHASIKTTMDIYTHLPKKRREKTMNKFSDYMES